MKKFNTNKRYISMNKTTFTIIAITILLLTSFIPVENSIATKENESKTIEAPVKIYTLQGIKEIRKELPLDKAMKLQKMAYETKEAMETLFNKNASFMERIRANEIIDSLLYEMKRNELLGNLTIKEAKELITGKYLQKQKNSIEMQKMESIAKSLKNNGWEVNAICLYQTGGYTYNFHPWNFVPMILLYWAINHGPLPRWVIPLAIFIPFCIATDYIPHHTTIGFWIIEPGGFYEKESYIGTFGLFGDKSLITNERIIALTFGFTGMVFTLPGSRVSVGLSDFVAFRKWQ